MDKSNFLTGLGKRIESRRRELNITQSEMAKKVGYSSHSTIAKAEAGLILILKIFRRKTNAPTVFQKCHQRITSARIVALS